MSANCEFARTPIAELAQLAGYEGCVEEASLRRILTILQVRWRFVGALALPVLLACWLYAATLPPSYTATVVMTFAPEEDTEPGAAFARLLSPYELLASSDETVGKAEHEAGLVGGGLRNDVSADLPANELELVLEVRATNAKTSTAAARSIVRSVEAAADEDPRVMVWNASERPMTDDGTPLRQLIIIGVSFVLAAVPGVFLAIWREGNHPRVWLPDDLRLIGIPVLHEVPRHHLSPRKRTRRKVPGNRVMSPLWETVAWERSHRSDRSANPADEVVVMSADQNADVAAVVAARLEAAAERRQDHRDEGATIIRAVPGATIDGPTAFAETDGETLCLLVVRSGDPRDQLQTVIDLVRGRGGRIFGSVFLRS